MAISIAGRTKVALVLLEMLLVAAERVAAEEPAPQARAAVDRSLAFLAKDALAWKEQRKCASCHHVPMGIWSLNDAKRRGYTIDERGVTELTAWVFAKDDPARVFSKVDPKEKFTNETVLLLALGIEANAGGDEATREGVKKLLSSLLEMQRPDGSWKMQSLTEPIGSTADVMTSWALLGLSAPNSPDMGQPRKEAIEKGLAWLSTAKPNDDLQTLAVKMLVWKRSNHPAAEWEPLKQQILAQQKPDGGWSQTKDMESDAYATGLALYALAEVGMSANDPGIAKARTFLIESQEEPGSWPMKSRPKERDNQPSKNLAPIKYSATAWATMGLMHTEPSAAGSKVSSTR